MMTTHEWIAIIHNTHTIMIRTFFLFVLSVAAWSGWAQQQSSDDALLRRIVDGQLRVKSAEPFRPMHSGEFYTRMEQSGTMVLKYSYKTGKVVDTLFNISTVRKCPVKSVEGYELDSAETKMLVYTNVQRTYRRVFSADYYVYDIKRRNIKPVSDGGQQEAATFSPDGRMIAFAKGNNLYLNKLDYGTEIAVTTDGKEDTLYNGMPDWLYEEEFDCKKLFVWSPDSKLIAFVRLDLSSVKTYSYIRYRGTNPEYAENALYPEVIAFRYPKAGTPIPQASVQVYDVYYKTIKQMKLGGDNDAYYPRLLWGTKPDQLAIPKFDRDQTTMQLFFANPRSTESKLILMDKSSTYVDYQNTDGIFFTNDGRSFTCVSEKDGYRHAYLYNINGVLDRQLTTGKFDLTKLYGYDPVKKITYFQAAEASVTGRDIYSADAKGTLKRLTDGKGTHSATFNSDFTCFVDNYSSLNSPGGITLYTNQGAEVRMLSDNSELKQTVSSLQLVVKESFTCQGADGTQLNGWIMKPKNPDAGKRYPVLMIQYSGPDSQEAADRWSGDWEYWLVTQGYVVACVDGRGTAARGEAFRKATYGKLGVLEAQDQIAAANYLGTLPFVDKNRIGIWGWSYGGFMTLMCMTTGDVFKAGIAVAPVTDWNFYDAAYTERYMKTPQENPDGYKVDSPLLNAANLQGNLLIICGLADDNVHPQNTFEFTEQLVQANKQFEMQVYTNRNHSIYGGNTRFHLYKRMNDFLKKNL